MRTASARRVTLAALALAGLAGPARAAGSPIPLAGADDGVLRVGGAPTALALAPGGLFVAGPVQAIAGLDVAGQRVPFAGQGAAALAVGPDGSLLAADARGLARLDEAGRAVWTAPLPGSPDALVAGADGRALALVAGRVVVVAPDGVVEGTWSLGHGAWVSLAYDAARGQVIAAGDVAAVACGEAIAAARVRATDLAGAPRWEAFGEPAGRDRWDRCRDLSPTHAVAVAVDGDAVLVAAEVERGGGDLFRGAARLVVLDAASDPDSAGDGSFAYYARLSADEGHPLRGQYLVPPAGAVAVRPQALAVDDRGHVLLAGVLQVAAREDAAPPLADGAPAFVQAVTADFSDRPLWWTFAASDAAETARVRLATAGGQAVALALAVDGAAAAVRWDGARDLGGAARPVGKKEDRPSPDTMELFGYESGASASNDDCFCSAEPRPLSAISILGVLALAGLRRRRGA